MARVILACATLKRELNMAMQKLNCNDPIIWLSAGDHNQPRKRRESIEQALRSCSGYDTVILAMTFCGNALVGLSSCDHTLLLPCCDDCISLLLDGPRQPDTYYLTDGWLDGERNLLAEYDRSLRKYGAEKTRRIFSDMLRGYRNMAWVNTGCSTGNGPTQSREAAELMGLSFTEVKGTISGLEELLLEQSSCSILRIPPHTTITWEMRRGMIPVTVINQEKTIFALPEENLLQLLRRNGLSPDAPCGGLGTCGKCTVFINDEPHKACSYHVTAPISVRIPHKAELHTLTVPVGNSCHASHTVAAVDIGTTGLVCSLLNGKSGERLAVKSTGNPQRVFGADVITRIRAALSGHGNELTDLIRKEVNRLLLQCCEATGVSPETVKKVCITGNPAMEQLFLGISPENLVEIPFTPVLKKTQPLPCGDYLPLCHNAELLIAPNISGYVGGDTVSCILSEALGERESLSLLVDIGTNGEMVLGNRNRLVACATAAGPALEGANISCGMCATAGAIDHVWLENGNIRYHTIDDVNPAGVCGSGLIDAVAVFLELGMINTRGRIIGAHQSLAICPGIQLIQEDIRQVQLAKGAIHAGILLMMDFLNISVEEIDSCMLAGAFGTYLNPESACRIGLLPRALLSKMHPIGNASLAGAEMMALDDTFFRKSQEIALHTQVLELASLPDFPRTYAKSMYF